MKFRRLTVLNYLENSKHCLLLFLDFTKIQHLPKLLCGGYWCHWSRGGYYNQTFNSQYKMHKETNPTPTGPSYEKCTQT